MSIEHMANPTNFPFWGKHFREGLRTPCLATRKVSVAHCLPSRWCRKIVDGGHCPKSAMKNYTPEDLNRIAMEIARQPGLYLPLPRGAAAAPRTPGPTVCV
jgi:hypothetical protein